MATGRYFTITSKMNDLVLDIQGGVVSAGTSLITYNKHGGVNQLFFLDTARNVIRCKANDQLVIDVGPGGELIINNFTAGTASQQWVLAGDTLKCLGNGQVADIAAMNSAPEAKVIAYAPNGGINQQWHLEYQPREYFQIVSKMNGRVLDIGGTSKKSAGSPVYMYESNKGDNQLWYEDQHGNLYSKLSGHTIKATDQGLVTAPMDHGDHSSAWCKIGDHIENRMNTNKCLDIAASEDENKAKVVSWEKHGGPNQQWTYVYI